MTDLNEKGTGTDSAKRDASRRRVVLGKEFGPWEREDERLLSGNVEKDRRMTMNIRKTLDQCFFAISRLCVPAVRPRVGCGLAALLAALFACSAFAGNSVVFSVDTRVGPRTPKDLEKITYSTRWNGGEYAKVSVNGIELGNFTAPAEALLDWNTSVLPNGDYTLTHSDGVEDLTATFRVAGSFDPVFEINGSADWADSVSYQGTYDGKAHGIQVDVTSPTENVTVTYALAKDGPFESTNPTWTNAGTNTVWFKVEAPYYPTLLTNTVVAISPKALTDAMVSQPADATYAGTAIEPAVTITDGTPSIITADDYAIAYSDNTDAGTAMVTVTGKRNYAGSVTKQFTIEKADIVIPGEGGGESSKPDIVPPENPGPADPISKYDYSGEYDGVGHTIDTAALKALTVATDDPLTIGYSLTKDGTFGADPLLFTDVCATSIWYKLSASNYNDYPHEAKVTITKRPISNVTVGAIADQTYTGSPIKPDVTVTDGEPSIIGSDDYAVSYENNVNAGTNALAIVSATADGNYISAVTNAFTIKPAPILPGGQEPDIVPGTGAGKTSNYDYVGMYDGLGHTIDTNALNALSIGTEVTLTVSYSLSKEGTYGAEPLLFTDVCATSIWYRLSAPNYADYVHEAAVTITNAVVASPTVASKVYDGQLQTADIEDTDLYTVTANAGGTSAGVYPVELTLVDDVNYVWSTTNSATVMVPFKIVQATNRWTTTPSIGSWTYGETACVPTAASQFGTPAITYSGTTTDGAAVSDAASVSGAGSYRANFSVAETSDYTGLSTNIAFTISRATLDDGTSSGGTAVGPVVVAKGYEGLYDGEGHSITVRVDRAGSEAFTIKYATAEAGTYSETLPLYTNAVSTSVWFKVESPNYKTFPGSRQVVITRFARLDGGIAWTFSRATATYFAQLKVTCTNGLGTGIDRLRFVFADRKAGDITLASLWNSHPSKRCAVEKTEDFGGETYRYVELDPSKIVSEGTEVVYGVSDLSSKRIPVNERIIELFVAKRVPPSGGNETAAGVDDFVGYLVWETGGETLSIPLVAGEAARTALRSSSLAMATPVSAATLNMAMAVGTPIEYGESPYCELQDFSVGKDSICGKVGVGAKGVGEKTRGAIGPNATVVLLGACNLGEPFEECGKMDVRDDGTFVFPKPEKFRFFKIRLGAAEIVR